MKQRTIYHSTVEPGRILFHRHGLPRIINNDILGCTPRSCRDCITESMRSRLPCMTALKVHEARLALRDTVNTIHKRSYQREKDYVTICELYGLAWELMGSSLPEVSKRTQPSSDQDTSTGVSITELIWDEAKLHWLVKWEPEDHS